MFRITSTFKQLSESRLFAPRFQINKKDSRAKKEDPCAKKDDPCAKKGDGKKKGQSDKEKGDVCGRKTAPTSPKCKDGKGAGKK